MIVDNWIINHCIPSLISLSLFLMSCDEDDYNHDK